jgi:cyclophilin family peptidyl-prolyl cis-trans isomerase
MTGTSIRNALIIVSALTLFAAIACGSADEPAVTAQPTAVSAPPAAVQPTAVSAQPTAVPASPAAVQQSPGQWDSPPALEIDPGKSYTATIELEKGGSIEIELFADKAPVTVNNFVFLARQGYYDGLTFHRVIPGFMAQTGDPTGTGSGGPGYRFDNEFHSDLRHTGPGILSMANAGVRNGAGTNGSQFFITYIPTRSLDGLNPDGSPKACNVPPTSCHAVFGKVVGGMDLVNGITERNPATANFLGDVIATISIQEK